MKNQKSWQTKFETELEQAQKARSEGNEGMARVCARRAAGVVIGEYLRRKDAPFNRSSAYEKIKYLISQPESSPQVREVAAHFLVRITPDHELPVEADLISEARWLAAELLGDQGSDSK